MLTFPFSFLMLSILFMSSIMVISSSNWIFIWLALEINMMSFIPLVLINQTNQETEASIKYFLIQALGSSMLLIFSTSSWYYSFTSMLMPLFLMMSVLIKLGAAPFHPWFPQVMSSMSWMNCLLLSTWQKLAPLILMCFMFIFSPVFQFFAPLTAMLGGILGINQSNLRSLMAYSSLVHLGWMMTLTWMGYSNMALMYFTLYSIIASSIFFMFHKSNSKSISFSSKATSSSPYYSTYLPLLLLSLSGLPPFLGFFMKWASISVLYEHQCILLVLIISSLMSAYYYLNLVFSSIMSHQLTQIINSSTQIITKPLIICMCTTMLPIIPLMWY